MNEIWVIVRIAPLYEVSDQGRVRKIGGEATLGTLSAQGHRVVMMKRPDGKWRTTLVQILVMDAFGGPAPLGVNTRKHLNGDPSDNRLSNLAWDSRDDGMTDTADTEWRSVPGFDVCFEVSNQGRVRELIEGQYIPVPFSVNRGGYRVVPLRGLGAKAQYVHHLVMLTFVGPRPEGMRITRHLDGDSQNNDLSNLIYGTDAENAADKIRHGRSGRERTRCLKGLHEFTPENTIVLENGWRRCRACVNAASSALYYGNRDERRKKRHERYLNTGK